MAFDPGALDLRKLFHDEDMFDSRDRWRRAGFDVLSSGEVMVAGHPSAPGYLFKKYANDQLSSKKQRKNFKQRIEGADEVRAFVTDRYLQRIVVPRKWLYERRDVLVVERLKILDGEASRQRYHDIDDLTLRDLITVLRRYRGLDSGVRNIPFTVDGKIAFIDTEHWDKERDLEKRPYLKHVYGYLSEDRKKLARLVLDRLGDR